MKRIQESLIHRVYFYLFFNLEGKVGVQVAQFHLVVKLHWVVTILWRIRSLEENKTEKLNFRKAVTSLSDTHVCTIAASSERSGSRKHAWSSEGLRVCKCQGSHGVTAL